MIKMTMQTIINLLLAYWGVIAIVIVFGVYAIFNWQNAKKIILGLMLQLEREAETLALSTGDAKFQFVVDKGYQLLPQGARVFITPAMFTSLAQSLYDGAKKYLTKYIPEPVTTPTIAPVIPVVVPADIPTPAPVETLTTPTTPISTVADNATADAQTINP